MTGIAAEESTEIGADWEAFVPCRDDDRPALWRVRLTEHDGECSRAGKHSLVCEYHYKIIIYIGIRCSGCGRVYEPWNETWKGVDLWPL